MRDILTLKHFLASPRKRHFRGFDARQKGSGIVVFVEFMRQLPHQTADYQRLEKQESAISKTITIDNNNFKANDCGDGL
jgi:hypothetical protein